MNNDFLVQCKKCGENFSPWKCPACGGDNTPDPFLKSSNVEGRMATIKEIFERILSRSAFTGSYFSALSIGIPFEKFNRLMPLPYVDEILATICGLGFIDLVPEQSEGMWVCYMASPNQLIKMKQQI